MSTIEDRVTKLETLMLAMLASKAAPPAETDTLDPKFLREPWADKTIKKDPPKWKGVSYVGKLYSQASAAWLLDNASFLEWKASKGRQEVPVRLKNNGKPWHEADSFEAKLCRTWAAQAHQPGPSDMPRGDKDKGDAWEPEAGGGDDDFGF